MKNFIFILISCLLLAGCSSVSYVRYSKEGQVQVKYSKNILVGTLGEVFGWLDGIFCGVFFEDYHSPYVR